MTEGTGFEPVNLSVNGFQDRRHRPLGHPSAMTLISGLKFILNLSGNPVNSFHVRPEHVGNNNASIGLLEIFQNSHYGSPDG